MTDSKPETPNIEEALKNSFDDGVKQGRKDMGDDVLKWLEDRYIKHPKRPKRGSPEAAALLKLAREMAKFLRGRK